MARKSWDESTKRLLKELGTYQLLGIPEKRPNSKKSPDNIFIIPLQTGTKTEQKKIAYIRDVHEIEGCDFGHKQFIFDGITEAVVNSIDHAYEKESSENRWWATSYYDGAKKCLRFFVYDHGIGIPKSLEGDPKWITPIRKLIQGRTYNDANLIEGALEVGRTRTSQVQRGKGLKQMADIVVFAKRGYMRILSGGGDVKVNHEGRYTSKTMDLSMLGTLIEWNIPIGHNGADNG